MKPETRLKHFIKKYWNFAVIKDGFSIWKDKITDIWFLVGFDINKKLIIFSKVESGSNLEKIQKIFPEYDFTLNNNEWNNVEFFPGFNHSINVMYSKENNKDVEIQGIGGMYEFF